MDYQTLAASASDLQTSTHGCYTCRRFSGRSSPHMPELGKKYTCYSCHTKFYDLGKPVPLCPKCGADQRDADDTPVYTTSRRAAASRAAAVVEEPAEDEDFTPAAPSGEAAEGEEEEDFAVDTREEEPEEEEEEY